MERSYLANGRFLQNIDQWTASNASYSAGDGDEHYGVAVVQPGGWITQTVAVPWARAYTLHAAIKPIGGVLTSNQMLATLTDGQGNQVVAIGLEGETPNTWQENTDTIGLAPGTTYTIEFRNNSALVVHVDDVWLWFVAIARAQIAAQVAARLGTLATEYSLSTTPAGALTEGDYTYAVDTGLRAMGAISPETGEVDIRYLDAGGVATVIDLVETEMLKRVQRSALTEVDVSLGPRRESLSQKAKMISEAMTGSGKGGGRVVVCALRHAAEDYNLG